MLHQVECSKPVILQFENPIGVIEWHFPLQERHRQYFHGHFRIGENWKGTRTPFDRIISSPVPRPLPKILPLA
jgi:hypothetical protein